MRKEKAASPAWLYVFAGALCWGLLALRAEKNSEAALPGAGVPVGVMVPFAGPMNHIPESDAWLLCDGRTLSRHEYGSLFACLIKVK